LARRLIDWRLSGQAGLAARRFGTIAFEGNSSMKRTILIAAYLACVTLLIAGCPAPTGDEGNANDNSSSNVNGGGDANGNSSGDTNQNSGSTGGNVTFRVEIATPPNQGLVQVLGFVDKGSVTRAAASASGTWDFRASRLNGEGGVFTSSFPRGTTICLICNESEFVLSADNAGVPPPAGIFHLQFKQWIGDFTTGYVGDDQGILVLTLDRDLTITAEFVAMNAVIVRSFGGAQGTGTDLFVEVPSQEGLTVPIVEFPGEGSLRRLVGTGLTNQQGQIGKWFYFRDGTVIELTVPDPKPFISWTGDGAIAGRRVTLTFGGRDQTVDVNWP